MSNLNKYISCFIDGLSVDKSIVNEKLEYNAVPEWDSIGHMSLISALEENFNVQIDTDDVIDFSSFQKGKEILLKYKIKID